MIPRFRVGMGNIQSDQRKVIRENDYITNLYSANYLQGDPYGRGIVYVDSKFEVAFNCKVGLLPRPATEL